MKNKVHWEKLENEKKYVISITQRQNFDIYEAENLCLYSIEFIRFLEITT